MNRKILLVLAVAMVALMLLLPAYANSGLISKAVILEDNLVVVLCKTGSSQMAGYIEISYTDDSAFNDSFKICYFIKNRCRWVLKDCHTVLDIDPHPHPNLSSGCLFQRTVEWKNFTFEVFPCSPCYKVVITPLGDRPLISIYFGEARLMGRAKVGKLEGSNVNWIGNLSEYLKYDLIVYAERWHGYSEDLYGANIRRLGILP